MENQPTRPLVPQQRRGNQNLLWLFIPVIVAIVLISLLVGVCVILRYSSQWERFVRRCRNKIRPRHGGPGNSFQLQDLGAHIEGGQQQQYPHGRLHE